MRAAMVAVVVLATGCAVSSGPPPPAADSTGASGQAGDVTVTQAFIPSPGTRTYPAGGAWTAQFTLSDSGAKWDTLTAVSTPTAGSVRLLAFDRATEQISVPTG